MPSQSKHALSLDLQGDIRPEGIGHGYRSKKSPTVKIRTLCDDTRNGKRMIWRSSAKTASGFGVL